MDVAERLTQLYGEDYARALPARYVELLTQRPELIEYAPVPFPPGWKPMTKASMESALEYGKEQRGKTGSPPALQNRGKKAKKAKLRKGKAKKNPSKGKHIDTVEQWHETGEAFHGADMEFPVLDPKEDKLACIGEIVLCAYVADKGGKVNVWVHGMRHNMFETDPEMVQLFDKFLAKHSRQVPRGAPLVLCPDNKTFMFQAQFSNRGILD
jgi:hypothetical protein